MLKPLPDQYKFDAKIRKLFDDGDLESIAGFLRKGASSVSRTLSPDRPDYKSPFYHTLEYLWAFDAMGKGQSAQVMSIINRNRQLWLPAPVMKVDAGKATSKIGNELMELMEKELAGVSREELLKEATDIKDAVDAKIAEILARDK